MAIIANAAIIKNATPVQNKSYVKKYTMAATIMAGISTRNSLIRAIMIMPIMTKTISATKPQVKLPRTEKTTVKKMFVSVSKRLQKTCERNRIKSFAKAAAKTFKQRLFLP